VIPQPETRPRFAYSPSSPLGSRRWDQIQRFADQLWLRREEVLAVLAETTTYRFAMDEVSRSMRALLGAMEEMGRTRPRPIQRLAAYMPSNVLLYSYVLYGVIPLLFAGEVVMRPSAKVKQVHRHLHAVLADGLNLPIRFVDQSQNEFWREEAAGADVVVFTGRYENGCQLAAQAGDDQLFLFFGSGVNPIVVGPGANLDAVVHDTVTMRTLNAGQDCICPDVIFVHERLCTEYVQRLEAELDLLPLGDRRDMEAVVTPLYYPEVAAAVEQYLAPYDRFITYGGQVDPSRHWVQPTVLVSDLHEMPQPTEFFAPVFNVVRYADEAALIDRLADSPFTEHGMGISVYGAPHLAVPLSRFHTVSLDRSFLDLENGNRPFGGFGERANFAQLAGQRWVRPLLISNEVGLAAKVGRLRSW
jgi:aldehyde dehydrogenase (NAD+)